MSLCCGPVTVCEAYYLGRYDRGGKPRARTEMYWVGPWALQKKSSRGPCGDFGVSSKGLFVHGPFAPLFVPGPGALAKSQSRTHAQILQVTRVTVCQSVTEATSRVQFLSFAAHDAF